MSPEDFTWQVGSADLGKKDFFSSNFVLGLVSTEYSSIHNLHLILFIAPKASAEGACILSKLGDSYEVWLVTVVVVCVVTVMV